MATELKQTTTREEALEALSIVEKTYGAFGYRAGGRHEETLLGYLLERHDDIEAAQETADKFRSYLWGMVAGGSVSASVAMAVYAALGRSEEADQGWI